MKTLSTQQTKNLSKNIFDNWEDVNLCTNCEHYWTSACDGSQCKLSNQSNENTSQTQNKPFCASFYPTRRYLVMEELNVAQKRLNWLSWAMALLAAVNILEWFVGVFR